MEPTLEELIKQSKYKPTRELREQWDKSYSTEKTSTIMNLLRKSKAEAIWSTIFELIMIDFEKGDKYNLIYFYSAIRKAFFKQKQWVRDLVSSSAHTIARSKDISAMKSLIDFYISRDTIAYAISFLTRVRSTMSDSDFDYLKYSVESGVNNYPVYLSIGDKQALVRIMDKLRDLEILITAKKINLSDKKAIFSFWVSLLLDKEIDPDDLNFVSLEMFLENNEEILFNEIKDLPSLISLMNKRNERSIIIKMYKLFHKYNVINDIDALRYLKAMCLTNKIDMEGTIEEEIRLLVYNNFISEDPSIIKILPDSIRDFMLE